MNTRLLTKHSLIFLGLPVVAVTTSLATIALRNHVDASHRAEILLARLSDESARLIAAEWQMIAEQELSDELANEVEEIRDRLDRLLGEVSSARVPARELNRVRDCYQEYAAAMAIEFQLIRDNRLDAARRVDQDRVDPAAAELRGAVEDAGRTSSALAQRTARIADIGSLVMTVCAAAVIALLFWKCEWAARLHSAKESLERMVTQLRATETQVRAQATSLENKVAELAAVGRDLDFARQQAEEANGLKSQFLANTSHELRTPLNGIMGYLRLVLDDRCDTKEEEREFLHDALRSSQHLLGLINDVLDVAKIEAGKLHVELSRVPVADLFHEVAAMSRVQAAESGLRLEFDFPPDDLAFTADAGRTKQILLNLLGNALKFTPKAGTIRVRAIAHLDEGQIHCEVSDSGPGIPKDEQDAIFQAFRQVDGTSTRQHGGAGLGLSIARRLSEMMGGFIWVDSEPGAGATFTFSLPACRGTEEDCAQSEEPSDAGLRRCGPPGAPLVLVVENDPSFRKYLCRLLHKEGFATIWASTADDGLAAIRHSHPTAVCLDYGLPAREGAILSTGWDLLVAIQKDPELQDVGVVMVSGFAHELRRRLSVAGAGSRIGTGENSPVHILEKPIDASDLVSKLRDACRLSHGTPTSILLADDDPTVGVIVRKAVEPTGCRVTVVTNGRACLDYLREHPNTVQLLLLDLMMPEMDGFDVLRALRLEGRAPNLPVMVLTGYPEMCTPETSQLLELGTVVPVLSKSDVLKEPERLGELIRLPAVEHVCAA